jgi:hypothetical protein
MTTHNLPWFSEEPNLRNRMLDNYGLFVFEENRRIKFDFPPVNRERGHQSNAGNC